MTGLWNHLPVLPVLLPLATAVALLALGDGGGADAGAHGNRVLRRARWLSLISVLAGLAVAVALLLRAADGTLTVYRLGAWPAPFGIALVVDRLSAMMLVLVQVVALPALVYASGGWDAHGRHFHALFQFQLMGLAGAFVTGDLFNLFVFFEVLLIASYVLMVHGHGRQRLRFGVPYVVLNLAASALFLVGMALVYAFTGTLNLADLALRVPQVPAPDAAVLQAGAMLLLVVFGFKAALLPLHLWLPNTYAATSAPVAALFALMTKVGVYAILRVHGVVFGDGAGPSADLVQPWLLPMALATGALGVLGALAAGTLARLVGWLNVASVGTIVAALGLFSTAAWSAALFYLVHSTLVVAALFLLAELVAAQRGDAGGMLKPASPVAQPLLLGLLLLLGGASVAGLPPLPGFLGKVMILQAAHGAAAPWVWAVVLGVGFFTLVGLARAGSILFWAVRPQAPDAAACSAGASPRLLAPMFMLVAATLAMVVWASPIKRYVDAAAQQVTDRAAYARAVLGDAQAQTVRPFRARPAGGVR